MYVHVPKNCLEFRQFGTSVKGRNAYFFRLVRWWWWWQSLLSYIFQLRLTWKYFFEKFRNMILYHKKFYILYKWSIGLNFDFQLMINIIIDYYQFDFWCNFSRIKIFHEEIKIKLNVMVNIAFLLGILKSST